MSAQRRVVIGEHTLTFEPPDLLVVRVQGVLRGSDVAAYVAHRVDLLGDQRYLLVLTDIRRMEGVEPSSRRGLAAIRDERPQVTAFLGGSFPLRVVSELVVNATRVFSQRKVAFRFFDEEAAARAWLVEMRRTFGGT